MVQNEAGRCQLMLFGIPTLVIADDPRLLATASAALAHWLAPAPISEPEIILRLARDDRPADRVSPAIRVEGSRLTIAGGGIAGEADARAGAARCRVPAWLSGDPRLLADDVLDTLLLFVAARRGRVPVHAAGVVIGGRAAVLAGPRGSGKSTLALAAAARGLPVLSDDTLYVEFAPALRVWGYPRAIHVFPSDAPAGGHDIRLRGGKLKHAIAIPAPARYADAVTLIVLARGDTVSLDPIASAEAIALLSSLEPGFDLLRAESGAAIAALAESGAWRLRLGSDPHAAIALLQDRFG